MKKSNLVIGILYIFVGIICLTIALFTESKLDGLFFGIAGAGIVSGVAMVFRYLYWSLPKNKEQYQQRLENENIEQHDELKEKIRDKSGRYAYVLGLITISISMLVFSALGSLKIINNSIVIILYLGGYLLFQIIAGISIFNHLLKKY